MGLIHKLSNEEYVGALLYACLRAPVPADGDVVPGPTDEDVLRAYDAGVPPALQACGRIVVERIVATEPRSIDQVARDAGAVAKTIHRGIQGALGLITTHATALPPPRGPSKRTDGVQVRSGGGGRR